MLNEGKKMNKISDQSETCLLGKTEGFADFLRSRPQAEIVAVKVQPPINMAATVNRESNIEPPSSKNTYCRAHIIR